jgi:hypothetical protein
VDLLLLVLKVPPKAVPALEPVELEEMELGRGLVGIVGFSRDVDL